MEEGLLIMRGQGECGVQGKWEQGRLQRPIPAGGQGGSLKFMLGSAWLTQTGKQTRMGAETLRG